MRRFSLLILLAACDLQPGKPRKEAPPPAPAPAAPAAEPKPAFPATETVDAGVKAPPSTASDECTALGAYVTKVVIDSMSDPNVKAAQEADQARMIRKIADTCTKDKWSDAARACFMAGKTVADLEACGTNLAAPNE